jgi:UDP-glucose 4-epimerase
MRALVTGGCGFIGSNLVDKLIASDWDVLVVDDMSSGNPHWRNGKAKYIFTDTSLALETTKFKKIDVIFHLAAEARIQPSYKNPLRWQQSNILGTAAVCEYARKNECKVILAGSSSCNGGKFMNPYTFSKKISEEMCEMYSKVFGTSTVTARFFNVYGPRNPMIGEFTPIIAKFEALRREGRSLTVVGDGEQRRDFTHVFDICAGLIKLAEKSWTGEIFNLGTGVNYSINELVEMFGCEKIHLPPRLGESRETKADISRTTSATGWLPQHNLEKYINNLKNT